MKTLPLLLAVLLLIPGLALAEPATTGCEKDNHAAAVVPHKKKAIKKKADKPVVFVAPPEKEVEIREVIKEVPVIKEVEVIKEVPVIVTVPVPVAAPASPVATPAPVAPVKKRPQHVDNWHPMDTDGLDSPPTNPPGRNGIGAYGLVGPLGIIPLAGVLH